MRTKIVKTELEKLKQYFLELDKNTIGDRLAKGVPLTKAQQDIYIGKSPIRRKVKNFKSQFKK